jgi:hypothetical protein
MVSQLMCALDNFEINIWEDAKMMEVAKHSAWFGALAAFAMSPAAFAQDLAPKT